MKRKEFLRNLTVMGAGFSMFSCGKDVIDGIVGENEMETISLAEAKKYNTPRNLDSCLNF
ncbi:hypothetical protein [Dyadobacter sp. 676]|uniref:Uncharacterized protein n=1 Tax=Dyadobacter sp. 676 TaxID=3088362 RepID=A0AAU8FNM3_9BACT